MGKEGGMSAAVPLSRLSEDYWKACHSLRAREGATMTLGCAAAFIRTQAAEPLHPAIERPCRQALADLGLEGIECIRPVGPEAA